MLAMNRSNKMLDKQEKLVESLQQQLDEMQAGKPAKKGQACGKCHFLKQDPAHRQGNRHQCPRIILAFVR